MIPLDTARELLDFRGPSETISEDAAEQQLRGAVAVHNLLATTRVAYLADEVGMGKTYVALGAVALFRHFDPKFRLLVIAPRENIQVKWMKEFRNFVSNNVRFSDQRVRAVHGAPARALVPCHSLIELVRETALNPDRDFFARLTSFSLPLGKDSEEWKRRRDELLEILPWLAPAGFDLRNRDTFKEKFGRAVCAALPLFDLVIVDEGHNLKHGFGMSVSARNQVLGLAFGHPSERPKGYRGYAPRAARVLFLSATPLENDYRQLWNQLDIFGLGDEWRALADPKCDDTAKRELAHRFLIRRVTSMQVGEQRLTKNLYRREWRNGGVSAHDERLTIPAADHDRQRLIVALVQKKVSEVLGNERFNNSFQIGMLASFESFLETAKVKPKGEDEAAVFDDSEQADDVEERLGVDVGAVNGLARSYRRQFGKELPHPKMDALVDHLAAGLAEGRKALVFVRRVASVKELQAKLEERYDGALIARLRSELPSGIQAPLEKAFASYQEERIRRRRALVAEVAGGDTEFEETGTPATIVTAEDDAGGLDTFFAWFFRGEGPPGILSGAALQRRFTQASSAYSTLFEDNYVAWLLGVRPGDVLEALASHLGGSREELVHALVAGAEPRLPAPKKRGRIGRLYLFSAMQESALAMLASRHDFLGERARVVLQVIQAPASHARGGGRAPAEAERWLEEPTVFTQLRARPDLLAEVWPEPTEVPDFRKAFHDRELRRLALSGAARLGHGFLDLWTLTVCQLGSLSLGVRQDEDAGVEALIEAYVELLDRQRLDGGAEFRAFRELRLVAEHFHLIVGVNAPDLRTKSLPEAAAIVGKLFGRQQPIGGMFGQINATLVRQFRLPGYPFVLVTTDLLQEGEDLHTFCSSVYHYGISWMPSSMEQRIGRIDRVNSHTERRLTRMSGSMRGAEKLQVYYPHLHDTVEVLQVRRVLERMNQFLRLMHRDLTQPEGEHRQVDIATEILRAERDTRPIEAALESAFPIQQEWLRGTRHKLAVTPDSTAQLLDRFRRIASTPIPKIKIEWEATAPEDALHGTVRRDGRRQPFSLLLRAFEGRILVRCFSPIARVPLDFEVESFAALALRLPVQISTMLDERTGLRLLAAEGEVLLSTRAHDAERTAWLIDRVTSSADRLERLVAPGEDRGLDESRDVLEGESDRGE